LLLVGSLQSLPSPTAAQDDKKMPETIILSKEAKLGGVRFSHLKHVTQKWSADGASQITCVACHHVAQPLAEALKRPPHKTVWPPDRNTTLTAELLAKDPTIVVPRCTDCHARADGKVKLLPEVPSLKFDGADEATVLNNDKAFHRSCGGCHDEVVKTRPALHPLPATSKNCTGCHKRTVT
jgi:hypothetical protein